MSVNKSQSTIKFLKQASNETLKILGEKNRCDIMIWAKNFIEKHDMKADLKDKAKHMQKEVQYFKGTFKDLFEKGLPSFWDNNGKMILKEKYDSLLKAIRKDHAKFQDMEKGLKGEVIIEILKDDFHVLNQLLLIKSTFPPLSYLSCVELEILST